eukprot:9244361-Pyramimonas_sp.AAC.1
MFGLSGYTARIGAGSLSGHTRTEGGEGALGRAGERAGNIGQRDRHPRTLAAIRACAIGSGSWSRRQRGARAKAMVKAMGYERQSK